MSTSTTLPKNAVNIQNATFLRPLVSFDGGNRSILWRNPSGQVIKIPSFIKALQDWEEAIPGKDSVLLNVKSKNFVVGRAAQEMKGIPVFSDDKIELAHKLILCALEPNPGQRNLTVEKLRIAVPDSRDKVAISQLKKLEGIHEFKRNNADIVAAIRKVELVDETKGAFYFAKKHNLFSSKLHINGILDVGGGTAIGRLYTPTGSLIREADLVLPGTFELANMIDSAILRTSGVSQDLSLIMDAIEKNSGLIGFSSISFKDVLESSKQQWIEEIRRAIRVKWRAWLPQTAEVLIIGGSASLFSSVQEVTKNRFKIVPKYGGINNFTQVINLLGMSEV